MKQFITNSKQETQQLAQKLGQLISIGQTFILKGNLGAGKTTFTQGFALGLGVEDRVNSPTFVIQKEYEGRLPLVHIDAYRLEGISQDLGLEDYFDTNAVVMIEWPEFLNLEEIQVNVIELERLDEDKRQITIQLLDKELEDLL